MKITHTAAGAPATLARMNTRKILLWGGFVVALCVAIGQIPRPSEAERIAYRERQQAAATLEETTVDACRAAIRFEFAHARPGLTREARALSDGSFLAVIPFSIGKLQREARCVGKRDGTIEFGVRVATL